MVLVMPCFTLQWGWEATELNMYSTISMSSLLVWTVRDEATRRTMIERHTYTLKGSEAVLVAQRGGNQRVQSKKVSDPL